MYETRPNLGNALRNNLMRLQIRFRF